MNGGASAKVIAAICGLSGFAIAVVVGLAVNNPADTVLVRAIVALLATNAMGWGVGLVLERIFRDAVASHRHAVESAIAVRRDAERDMSDALEV